VFGIILVAVVGLHEARVARAAGRSSVRYERAAVRFLDDGSEDDAVVDEGSVGAVLDGVVDVLDDLRRVVGATAQPATGVFESVVVGGPHVLEGDPTVCGREVRGIAMVVRVAVGAGADADGGIVYTFACCATRVEGQSAVDLRKGRCVFEAFFAGERDCKRDDNDQDDGGEDS